MKLTASSMGITSASLKKADCRMVLVRLPIPISIALSIALMVYSWMLLSAMYFLASAFEVIAQLLIVPTGS